MSALLTADDVAVYLKVDPSTVRRLVRRGQLPRPIKFNRKIARWRPAQLERFFDSLEGKTN